MSYERDPMLEFSTALTDLVDLMERRGTAQLVEVARSAAVEIGTPLAEMLEAVQRMGPELVRGLTAALAQVKSEAPVVNVNVPAMEVTVPTPTVIVPVPEVTVPVPEVIVQIPQTKGWDFTVDYYENGALKGLKARRVD